MLDAPTEVIRVVAPEAPQHAGGVFAGRAPLISKASGPRHPISGRTLGVLAAIAAGVVVAGSMTSSPAATTTSTAPRAPVAGEVIGSSALGCDVQSMGSTTSATSTDPVCTREAIVAIACGLDVSEVTPVEQYHASGNYYLWADAASMAQFTTTVSGGSSTTTMLCQSGGSVQQLQFTGDEWAQFNGVGTLSSTMRSKLESA